MKKEFDLIIIIPVGPNCKMEYIIDTIESIQFYCRCTFKIVLSDDSQKGMGKMIQDVFQDVEVLLKEKNYGLWGGLYVTLALAYKHVLDRYEFKALLRMDTDALITGINPQEETIAIFEENEHAGMVGFHRSGKFTKDFMGTPINNSWARDQILANACSWRMILKPIANYTLRKTYFNATYNGYELGESIFGGAYFISPSFLKKMDEEGYLPNYNFRGVMLEEDHIFSMLARLLSFELIDLSMGTMPFGCAWKGLPASPETLWAMKKKIIHSTRYWADMKEPEIRAFFKEKRDNNTV
jgi:hypothetical protein